MIGPPGLPKVGRRIYSFVRKNGQVARHRGLALKWALGLYFAGVLAHSGHHMAYYLPEGLGPSLAAGLTGAPTSLAWPADLIATLITLG
jgi:hypothetical protein